MPHQLLSPTSHFYSYKELKLARWRKLGRPIPSNVTPSDAVTVRTLLFGGTPFYSFWEFFSIVAGPYLLIHFFLFPLPLLFIGEYLGLGSSMYNSAVKNLFYAELMTNAHAFLAIVTNHAGNDMYRFREGCRPYSGSFYLRQVLASVDFWTGSDLNDFMHGYLNYQIEHHLVSLELHHSISLDCLHCLVLYCAYNNMQLTMIHYHLYLQWPSLSMLSYKRSQPLVKALCQKHGVPYVQENVFLRLKKTVDIMTGSSSMRWFPEDMEKKLLERDAVVEAEKKDKKTLLSDRCMAAVEE